MIGLLSELLLLSKEPSVRTLTSGTVSLILPSSSMANDGEGACGQDFEFVCG